MATHKPLPDAGLVAGVVALLCQHAATHPKLWDEIEREMKARGYRLACRLQEGASLDDEPLLLDMVTERIT